MILLLPYGSVFQVNSVNCSSDSPLLVSKCTFAKKRSSLLLLAVSCIECINCVSFQWNSLNNSLGACVFFIRSSVTCVCFHFIRLSLSISLMQCVTFCVRWHMHVQRNFTFFSSQPHDVHISCVHLATSVYSNSCVPNNWLILSFLLSHYTCTHCTCLYLSLPVTLTEQILYFSLIPLFIHNLFQLCSRNREK